MMMQKREGVSNATKRKFTGLKALLKENKLSLKFLKASHAVSLKKYERELNIKTAKNKRKTIIIYVPILVISPKILTRW